MKTEKAKSGTLSHLSHLSRPVDLTRGTPWKVILLYAAPIMLSYLLQQIYVLTDAIICGQVLRAEEVAGVNDTFALTFILLDDGEAHRCVQLISIYGICCNYFKEAVLPGDRELYEQIKKINKLK